MRTPIFVLGALVLFGVAQPANAQMCGSQQQAQSSGGSMMSGGMCGMMGKQAETEKPTPKQHESGMCPCCRNMAGMGQQPQQKQ